VIKCALRTILVMCSLKRRCESTTTPRSHTFSDTVKHALPRRLEYLPPLVFGSSGFTNIRINTKLNGCIALNEHNTVFASNRSATSLQQRVGSILDVGNHSINGISIPKNTSYNPF